jgi:thymidine phosphorylase
MDCKALGLHSVSLGGGRHKTTDLIDFAVGLMMNKKIGDKVKKGEVLVTIHCHENHLILVATIAESIIKKDIVIQSVKPRAKKKLIIEIETKFAPKKIQKKTK